MNLKTAFEEVEDDDLLYSFEHWDSDDIAAAYEDTGISSDALEAFVHPRTGTGVRIFGSSSGTYSVQPAMGSFADFDNVVQSDDPSTAVSGSASVTMTEIESLSEARAIAYAWMRGWVMRNSSIGRSEGDVRDSERDDAPVLHNA